MSWVALQETWSTDVVDGSQQLNEDPDAEHPPLQDLPNDGGTGSTNEEAKGPVENPPQPVNEPTKDLAPIPEAPAQKLPAVVEVKGPPIPPAAPPPNPPEAPAAPAAPAKPAGPKALSKSTTATKVPAAPKLSN